MSVELKEVGDLLDWGDPQIVQTVRGTKIARKCEIPFGHAFWELWKYNKDVLSKSGISVGKWQNKWWATWWQDTEQSTAPKQQETNSSEILNSWAQDSDYQAKVPDGMELLPYQRAGVAFAIKSFETRQGVLLGDSMGLGKTIQAIATANNLNGVKQVMIACPSSLRLNWLKEWGRWSTLGFDCHVVTSGKESSWQNSPVIIISYDLVAKHKKRIALLDIDLLIVDEAQYLKTATTARTKAVYGEKGRGGIKAKRTLLLSGTPITNKPVDLWTMLEKIDPNGLGKDFMGYAKRYCNAQRVSARWSKTGYAWDFNGASNLQELQNRLRSGIMIRRLREDVLKDIPPKQRQVIEIPPDDCAYISQELDIIKQHDEAIAKAEALVIVSMASDREYDYANALENLRNVSSIPVTEMSEFRKNIALAKVPYCIEHIGQALQEGPVVAFAHHSDVIDQIYAEFDNVVKLTGSTKLEDRQRAVDQFQAGRAKLFVGNIQAAGVGITLTASSHVVFTELSWVPADMIQCEDRLCRIGQAKSVLVQYLVFTGSLDARMAKTLAYKQSVIDRALDKSGNAISLLTPSNVDKIDVTREEIMTMSGSITQQQMESIASSVQFIASNSDLISSDGLRVSKIDGMIAERLTSKPMTNGRAVIGSKLVEKYDWLVG